MLNYMLAVGLSNLQLVNLNNQRNLFVLGFAIFNSMSIAGPGGYFATVEGNPFGTSNGAAIALSIFSPPMIVAFIISLTLDATSGGATPEERGLSAWEGASKADVNNDPEYVEVYSLPLFFAKTFRNCAYLEYTSRGKMPNPPENGVYQASSDLGDLCCPCLFRGDLDEEDNENNEEKEKGEPGDSPIGNAMIRSTACNDDLDVEVASAGEKAD